MLSVFFFFKQKTAYEMRISDWSSDVCSSDLLGAGRIGRVHAINIAGHARSQLIAVSAVDADAAQSLAGEHGARVGSTEAILGDTSIDAVLIATSTDTHSDLIERATAAGKAVQSGRAHV